MRITLTSFLVCLFVLGCGDEDDDKPKGGGGAKANAAVHAYCVAQCGRNEECGVENALFDGDDCITVCEGFTIAFGDCNPPKAVVDACVDALETRSCADVEAEEDPAECETFCE